MTDKYIINPPPQQGQPQNQKSAVGSPNVVETIGGRVPLEERVDEGPVPPPDHPHIPGIYPRNVPGARLRDSSGKSMGQKIGK